MIRPRLTWGARRYAAIAAGGSAGIRRRRRPPKIDSGDTAWMLASTALVLLMTVPGLALFYGGMVRKKNILATLMQSLRHHLHRHHRLDASPATASPSRRATPYVGDLSRFMLHGIADHIAKGNDTQAFVLAIGDQGRRADGHDDP